MSPDSDYCIDPEKCRIGFSLKHFVECLDKNNDLLAKRLEKLEENIIAIRDDISAFRSYQDTVADVKQSIVRVHERIDDMPKMFDKKIESLRIDDRFESINAKIENKISYRQATLIVSIVLFIFTIINFAISHVK